MAEQAPNKLTQSEIEREAIEALSCEFRPSLVRYFSKRCKETTAPRQAFGRHRRQAGRRLRIPDGIQRAHRLATAADGAARQRS